MRCHLLYIQWSPESLHVRILTDAKISYDALRNFWQKLLSSINHFIKYFLKNMLKYSADKLLKQFQK